VRMIGCIEEVIPSSGGGRRAAPRRSSRREEPSDYVTQTEIRTGTTTRSGRKTMRSAHTSIAPRACQTRLVAAQTMRCARNHSCDIFFCAHYGIDQAAMYTAEPGTHRAAKICDVLAASLRASFSCLREASTRAPENYPVRVLRASVGSRRGRGSSPRVAHGSRRRTDGRHGTPCAGEPTSARSPRS
jgi:hypothetical protein